jgi:uncharacterized protein (DUF58 family)
MNAAAPRKERFDPKVLSALAGLQFRAKLIVEGYLSGINKSPFHGYSSEFREYREYQPGDDLRRLDWRLYARADRLCIRRYEQETNLQFYVVLDTSKSMLYGGSRAWCAKLDFACLLASSLTWLMLKQKDSAGLLMMEPGALTGQRTLMGRKITTEPQLCYLKPSQKPSQLGQAFRHLEAISPMDCPCLGTLLDHSRRLIRRRGVILLISDLLDPTSDLKDHLEELRFLGHEILAFHVLDPDEQDFPFEDSSVFEDLENGVRRKINPNKARAKYQERLQNFLHEIRDFFQNLQISYHLMPTDGDPTNALAFFLAQRKLFI